MQKLVNLNTCSQAGQTLQCRLPSCKIAHCVTITHIWQSTACSNIFCTYEHNLRSTGCGYILCRYRHNLKSRFTAFSTLVEAYSCQTICNNMEKKEPIFVKGLNPYLHMRMRMMMATSKAHGLIDLNAECAEGDYRQKWTEKVLGRQKFRCIASPADTEKETSIRKQVSFQMSKGMLKE